MRMLMEAKLRKKEKQARKEYGIYKILLVSLEKETSKMEAELSQEEERIVQRSRTL